MVGLLSAEETQLLETLLSEIVEACCPLANRRGVRPDWVLTMLPDLAATLPSEPAQAAGQAAPQSGD
jgi:hypothetical protein